METLALNNKNVTTELAGVKDKNVKLADAKKIVISQVDELEQELTKIKQQSMKQNAEHTEKLKALRTELQDESSERRGKSDELKDAIATLKTKTEELNAEHEARDRDASQAGGSKTHSL